MFFPLLSLINSQPFQTFPKPPPDLLTLVESSLERNIPEEYRSRSNSKQSPYTKSRLKSRKSNQYPYAGHSRYEFYTFEYMEERWKSWEKKFEAAFPS
jgi:hypothetical protein